jgi:high-affinity Fe2+/Pb2+ permease
VIWKGPLISCIVANSDTGILIPIFVGIKISEIAFKLFLFSFGYLTVIDIFLLSFITSFTAFPAIAVSTTELIFSTLIPYDLPPV